VSDAIGGAVLEERPRASRAPWRDPSALFLLAALALFVVTVASFREFGHDAWWHLATGDWILQHHEIPRADPFSSTARGEPWVDHEWGFQILLSLIHRATGVPGLVAFRVGVVVLAGALLVAALLAEGLSLPVAALLVALAAEAARVRFQIRPELATLLLCTLLVSLFSERSGRRLLALAAPLFVLWANLHPGFLLGLVLLAAHAAGGTLDLARARFARTFPEPPSAAEAISRWGALAAAAAASCLNPFGVSVFLVPGRIRSAIAASHLWNPEWWPTTLPDQPLFFALLGTLAVLLLAGIRRAPGSLLLVSGALAAFALRYVRGIGTFGLAFPLLAARAAGPFLAELPAALRARLTPRAAPRTRLAWLLGTLLLLVSVCHALWDPVYRFGYGVDEKREPVGAADFLLRERPAREMYNEIGDGGYLIWRLGALYPAFLDGRNEVYSKFLPEWTGAQRSPELWAAFLEGRRVKTAVVRYQPPGFRHFRVADPGLVLPVPFSRAYFAPSEWALVYWDDHDMILLRRVPEHEDLIRRSEYRCLHPEDLPNTLARASADASFAACVRGEIVRRLGEEPLSDRAEAIGAAVFGRPARQGAGR